MKELLEFIKDFMISIGREINDNEGKGLLSTFFILIGLILFISPGCILMFFCNEKVLVNNFISTDLVNILIIDSIIFMVLFVIGLARNIKVPKDMQGNIVYKDDIIISIIKTIASMTIISIVLIVIFTVVNFENIDYVLKVGIITLIITIILLTIKHILTWVKLFYRFVTGKANYKKAKEYNKKAKEVLNNLPDDDDDEI
ncbi:hypothetical protein LPC13_13330 [Clostridium celatum]|uniref:hypothetical protein n=1 Tax=Clostridium celatum TaxID=36834 RepID=UPI001F1B3505|nr:hypothetical protein [Clostridium celatum]MCE9656251.1 hypothetical protein [Clostridium celatum]